MPVEFYPTPRPRPVQAQQIWNILVGFVGHGCVGKLGQPGLITYGELADKMGYRAEVALTLHDPLTRIAHFCEANDIPYLNAVVVNLATGEAGAEVRRNEAISLAQQVALASDEELVQNQAGAVQETAILPSGM